MPKGFVGGFVKHEERWIGQWIQVPQSYKKRAQLLEEAHHALADQLAAFCGGAAVARRNMIIVDGLCPNGRELLEKVFEALREPVVEEQT